MSAGGSPRNSTMNHEERENIPPPSLPVDPSVQPHAQPTPPSDDVTGTVPANQQADVQAEPQNLNSRLTYSDEPEDSPVSPILTPPLPPSSTPSSDDVAATVPGNQQAAVPAPNENLNSRLTYSDEPEDSPVSPLPTPPLPPSSSNTPPGQQPSYVAIRARSPNVLTESSQTHETSLGSYRPLTLEASPRKTLRSRSMSPPSSHSVRLLPSKLTAGSPGSPTDDIKVLPSSTATISPGSPSVVPNVQAGVLELLDLVIQAVGSNSWPATNEDPGRPSNDESSAPKPLVSRSETSGRVADISSPASSGAAVHLNSRASSSPVVSKWREAGLQVLDFVTQSSGSNAPPAANEEPDGPLNDAPSTPNPLELRSEASGRVADISSPTRFGVAVHVSSRAISPPVVHKRQDACMQVLGFVTQSPGSNARPATNEEPGRPLNDAPSTPKPLVSRSETSGRVADISSPASLGAAVQVSSRANSRFWRDPRDAAETTESEGGPASPRFPWVTVIVIALQVRAHWDFLHEHYPGRCASAAAIADDGHWELVAYAAFHHEDIGHLASNVIPFFIKAVLLESVLGMTKFAVVLTIIVLSVGLLNVTIAQAVFAITKASGVHTACAQTFVGVVAAMEVINRLQFGDWRIHYREVVCKMKPLGYMYLEMALLSAVSERNFIPLLSGLLVGFALVFMPLGNIVTSTTKRKGHVYLYAIPHAPVAYVFAASILAAFLFGPYPTHSTESALTFKFPIGNWWLFPALYIGDAFQLTYVLLSLLVEGVALEQHLGHCRFLRLAAGMLFFVNFLQDVLTWTVWNHSDTFFGSLPPAVRHSSTCSCGLVGTLLALKIVRHRRHLDGVFQMASFCIPLPFWQALILELLHLHLFSSSGSSFGHVTGVLTGIFVAYCPWDHVANLAAHLGGSLFSTTPRTL